MRAPYDLSGSSADAKRKANQRRYTGASRLVVGEARVCRYPDPTIRTGTWPDAHIVLPVRTKTEGNANESWRMRAKRCQTQRLVTAAWLQQLGAANWRTQIVRVRFVRLAPKQLDNGDNLCSSSKHIRDQVAAWMAGENTVTGKGNDGPSSGIDWDQNHQEVTPTFGVRVEFYLSSAASGGTT